MYLFILFFASGIIFHHILCVYIYKHYLDQKYFSVFIHQCSVQRYWTKIFTFFMFLAAKSLQFGSMFDHWQVGKSILVLIGTLVWVKIFLISKWESKQVKTLKGFLSFGGRTPRSDTSLPLLNEVVPFTEDTLCVRLCVSVCDCVCVRRQGQSNSGVIIKHTPPAWTMAPFPWWSRVRSQEVAPSCAMATTMGPLCSLWFIFTATAQRVRGHRGIQRLEDSWCTWNPVFLLCFLSVLLLAFISPWNY